MSVIADIDARLARLACDVVVDGGGPEAVARLRSSLDELAAQVEAGALDGGAELAAVVRRAAVGATASDLLITVEIVDAAWSQWKASHGAGAAGAGVSGAEGPAGTPDVADITPAPPGGPETLAPAVPAVDADVAALAADRELAGMFIAEALDHLSSIEAIVLDLEAHPTDARLLDEVFRPFHTVKGNAGALGVQTVQALAHKVETLLDRCRAGRHVVGRAEIDVILRAVDLLSVMMADLGHRLDGQPGVDTTGERFALLALVDAVLERRRPAPEDKETGSLFDAALPKRDPVSFSEPQKDPIASFEGRRHDDHQSAIKVDTRKLDTLVDMIGELVIVQSIIFADARLQDRTDEHMTRCLAQLKRITGELQRSAMAMRMVPIRQTFQKMARLVRDLSKLSGKPVDLVLEGEDTELDRKVVEAITDPVMHMIRNSIDHGIEDAATRAARGKPAAGQLLLRAYHQGSSIVIEIRDDGGGLDPARILRKAVQQGLVAPDAALEPAEIFQLIFRAGFSTAEQVTEISGRGVGMDVVRQNIEQLRGRVDIQSEVGRGATFAVKLPITLAIVDGLLLQVGEERFVLPVFSVRESLRPTPDQIHGVHGRACLLRLRDELVPFAALGDLLNLGGARVTEPWHGTMVVVEDDGGRAAILVDALLGKQEVVIKALGEPFSTVRGVSGGAILGDGRIGLILDGGALVKMMRGGAAAAA